MKRLLSLFLVIAGIVSMTSCSSESTKPLNGAEVIHEPEFGGIYIKNTIEEFNALGYKYGDSVDIEFSNGYKLTGIPYYNGYYTQNGETLLVAYPGYEYIKAAINNGDDLWVVAGLEEGMTASVSLNKSGTFNDIQNARDIHYTDNREDYDSDEIFANFRAVKSSSVKENTLFRSASPCDNQHNRATYVDSLMKESGISFILDLADNEDKIKGYMSADGFACPNFSKLYEEGNVLPIALNMNYGSDEFKEKVANGLTIMAKHKGPYLVHCTEGKDRTGFVCMLLEALAGADYKEIEEDYMITYSNYYDITSGNDPDRYSVIVENVLKPMIRSIIGDENADIESADLGDCAAAFLEAGGMSAENIALLKKNITA